MDFQVAAVPKDSAWPSGQSMRGRWLITVTKKSTRDSNASQQSSDADMIFAGERGGKKIVPCFAQCGCAGLPGECVRVESCTCSTVSANPRYFCGP